MVYVVCVEAMTITRFLHPHMTGAEERPQRSSQKHGALHPFSLVKIVPTLFFGTISLTIYKISNYNFGKKEISAPNLPVKTSPYHHFLFAIIHYLVSLTRAPNGSHLLKLQDFRFTQMGI